jgi:hypothetical protein
MRRMWMHCMVVAILIAAIAALLLAPAAAASDLGDMLNSVQPTLGTLYDHNTHTWSGGAQANFRMDTDGNVAEWLKDRAEDWKDSGKIALQILAVPVLITGHLVDHAEVTTYLNGSGDGLTLGGAAGFGARFGPSDGVQLHIAREWKLSGGAPLDFIGLSKSF